MCRLLLIELDGALPAGRVIPAEQLATHIQQVDEARCAHRQAKAIVNAARRKAQKLIREMIQTCRQMEADKHRELEAARQQMLERCEAQWLQEHVTQLLDDEAREQALVHALSGRIQQSLEQVLNAWFEQQPQDKTLCARLACRAQEMAQEGILTLHIHPELEECMRAEFGSRFVIAPEPGFAKDRAELASSQLSVAFSLSGHFQQLLAWLRSTYPLTGEPDESTGHHGTDYEPRHQGASTAGAYGRDAHADGAGAY